MGALPTGFAEVFRALAGAGYYRCTLQDLAILLELAPDIGTLGQIERIRILLAEMNIECVPGLDRGELTSSRTLVFGKATGNLADELRVDCEGGECARIEFKSTLLFDIKRFEAETAGKTCETFDRFKSEKVLESCLKTIAAFANGEGGRLYVGVADDGKVLGIQQDYLLDGTANKDRWELALRDYIKARFKDGAIVNDYVQLEFIEHNGVTVARIDVTPREVLSFTKTDKNFVLYRRQGNRTVAVDITEIEEFLRVRWQK